jgi:mevalonate kinase
MFFGEHAVLQGYPAIVCALNSRLRVLVKKRHDHKILVQAMGLSKEVVWTDRFDLSHDFRFLEACISSFEEASTGLDIIVESSLESTKGFGSSSALIAAALLAISRALGLIENENLTDRVRDEIFLKGIGVLRSVQGFGSGADLAASIYGGCLEYSYSKRPRRIQEPKTFYLTYCGHKTPTSEVLAKLHQKKLEGLLDTNAIHELGRVSVEALALWDSISHPDIRARLCEKHQQAMARLGLVDESLEKVCHEFKRQGIEHKISGSGLGDCVLSWEPPVNIMNVSSMTPDLIGLSLGSNSSFLRSVTCDS